MRNEEIWRRGFCWATNDATFGVTVVKEELFPEANALTGGED